MQLLSLQQVVSCAALGRFVFWLVQQPASGFAAPPPQQLGEPVVETLQHAGLLLFFDTVVDIVLTVIVGVVKVVP